MFSELTVKRDQSWLYPALVITLAIHLAAVSPLSKWFDRMFLPMLFDENIEVDLLEMQPDVDKAAEKIQEKQTPESDQPESPLRVYEKRRLSADLKEDKIVSPDEKGVGPPPKSGSSAAQKAPEKKILDETRSSSEKISEQVQQRGEPESFKKKQAAATDEKKRLDAEEVESPLFVGKRERNETQEKQPENKLPEEVGKTFRGDGPEETDEENLQYSLNTYKWTFERFMENWAADIQKWWKAPMDYAFGNVPEGGSVWVQVRLNKYGRLEGYRIFNSTITPEMELRVVQALIGSLKRPVLPESFTEEELMIYWKFIYPPIRPPINLRR